MKGNSDDDDDDILLFSFSYQVRKPRFHEHGAPFNTLAYVLTVRPRVKVEKKIFHSTSKVNEIIRNYVYFPGSFRSTCCVDFINYFFFRR
jgi:hypothetical protein